MDTYTLSFLEHPKSLNGDQIKNRAMSSKMFVINVLRIRSWFVQSMECVRR